MPLSLGLVNMALPEQDDLFAFRHGTWQLIAFLEDSSSIWGRQEMRWANLAGNIIALYGITTSPRDQAAVRSRAGEHRLGYMDYDFQFKSLGGSQEQRPAGNVYERNLAFGPSIICCTSRLDRAG